ncbi:hypothetical protein LMJ53_14470 [Rheinheimera sp. UJ51]|uniref:hypothetical protein n=1 Tax=Rheinheimera sp. UJ51 TaxID=2892446 RepID=UPI001E576D18|nr:hypothetical protein [Rheinheimera sp. UJ51]MCC5452929.1 hypothetical protein [Rheinheimera sp. UJ51]
MNNNTLNREAIAEPCGKKTANNKKPNANNMGVDRLSLTLKRQVQLKRFPLIAKVTFCRQRSDLVALLKAMTSSTSDMPARLKAYLVKENLWDEMNNAITSHGQQVVETGLFNTSERNLYHIWFTDNDPLLGTRPILMQRDSSSEAPKYQVWKKGRDAVNSEFVQQTRLKLVVMEEEYKDRKNTELQKTQLIMAAMQPEVICSPDKSANLEMQWTITPEISQIHLTGELDIRQFSGKNHSSQPESIDLTLVEDEQHLPSLMDSVATALSGNWNNSTKRLSTTLEQVEGFASAVSNFRIGNFNCKAFETDYGNFTSVQAAHIPIQPQDQDDAENWHRFWLDSFYRMSYRSPSDANRQQGKWLDSPALASFELPLKQPQSLIAEINREQQPEAYWHIAAVADLSPNNSNKLHMPFSLIGGDEFDIYKLVSKLTDRDVIEHVIYSDRYVHTAKQYLNLSTLARACSDANGLLLTLKPQNGKPTRIPENWERNYIDKNSDNHGRYWIFIGTRGTYCWECTSGLDFIKNENGWVTVDGFPTFTPKAKHELPGYLQQHLNDLTTEENY